MELERSVQKVVLKRDTEEKGGRKGMSWTTVYIGQSFRADGGVKGRPLLWLKIRIIVSYCLD
jgi:hypothetical protein